MNRWIHLGINLLYLLCKYVNHFLRKKTLKNRNTFFEHYIKTYGYILFVSSISSHFKSCYFNQIKRGICFCFFVHVSGNYKWLILNLVNVCINSPNSKVNLSLEKINNVPTWTKSSRAGIQIQVTLPTNTHCFSQVPPSLFRNTFIPFISLLISMFFGTFDWAFFPQSSLYLDNLTYSHMHKCHLNVDNFQFSSLVQTFLLNSRFIKSNVLKLLHTEKIKSLLCPQTKMCHLQFFYFNKWHIHPHYLSQRVMIDLSTFTHSTHCLCSVKCFLSIHWVPLLLTISWSWESRKWLLIYKIQVDIVSSYKKGVMGSTSCFLELWSSICLFLLRTCLFCLNTFRTVFKFLVAKII